MRNYTYFSISGEFIPAELIQRIGVEPQTVVLAGQALPSGEIAEKNTLLYGVSEEVEKPLVDCMLFAVTPLLEREEFLGRLKAELGLTYYLFIPDDCKNELIIVPAPLARFLYLSGTFRDLDYYTF